MREFVNYRHPDPRRVWKVGSELQSLPPFPLHPVLNSFWLQNAVYTIKNGSDPPPKASIFPSWPQPGPEQAQGIDKGRQRAPEASKSEPKGIQWHAKVGQREPNKTRYIPKLPINRPSGRCYVNKVMLIFRKNQYFNLCVNFSKKTYLYKFI